MSTLVATIGWAVMLLFDRSAAVKQIIARWIVASVIVVALGLMATVVVQMFMMSPEHMTWLSVGIMIMVAFFWGMANSHDEQE